MESFQQDDLNWDRVIAALPAPHFLQTCEWGQVKAKYGWKPYYALWMDDGTFRVSETDNCSMPADRCAAACLVLKRTASFLRLFQVHILYAPKGPLLNWSDESLRQRVLDDLQSFAKSQRAIFVKIDPDVVLGRGIPLSEGDVEDKTGTVVLSELTRRGWNYSSEQIQFKNTVLVDLSPTEEEMLARMKQKTRYNIRLAQKKGVAIRDGNLDDLPMLYKMYAETSARDGFVIRDREYYMTVWNLFMSKAEGQRSAPLAIPLIAEVNNEPVAAIFLFMYAGRVYYVYGMSRDMHREKMPTYLLQWEAMKRAKNAGCKIYDLWGAPDEFNENDSMWGVYRFKEGLGGEVTRTLGAYDFAPNKIFYKLYMEVMPRVLDVMRRRGKARTRQALE